VRDEDIVKALRAESYHRCASELADLLDQLSEEGLSQGSMISYFKRAFPEIPLRILIDASGWSRLSGGGLGDLEFNAMLSSWLPRRTRPAAP
jgi:hypothetical protein